MVDSAVQVIADVAKCLAAPIARQFSYVRNYKTNLDSLKEEAKQLMEERECVHHRVEAAERNGEEIEQKVQTWLTNADKIINEAGEIMEDEEKANSHCCKGLFPNFKTRYQLSKNAEAKVKAIVRLKEEGKFPQASYKTIPQEIWIPATKAYESFESRMSTLRDIQNALSDPNINMIGLYGMGGIGKTMLVREIARQAENERLFDQVVFATVTQIPNIKSIQGEIADKLGLEFREESESGRARKLHERLRKERKILVILDNIWTDVDLHTIGIPFGDDHKECKVLLTARSQDVLSSKMNCENNFLVSILNEDEAWVLFKKMAGDHIENHDFQSIAIYVVQECGGLPLAIVTIARALRDKNISIWRNALQELRKPSERNFTGVQAVVYSTIELSYNHLENDELRSIFLLCSLMCDDALMLDLLKYSMGLGLLQGIDTMEQARDRLYTLVHKLKASCLLLDGETSEEFCMHDVVRDVALSIASRDQHIYAVRDEVVSIKWPSKDTLESCTAISLPECNIRELPEGLECPQLKIFLLQNQDSFVKIPQNFFKEIEELRVLDFSGMQLSSLPSSIHLLVNLRTLCLHECALRDIAIIGELQKLEILSFSGSDIEQLPKEIGHLSSLRLLDLSNCNKLKVIPPNVISSLSFLEELYMGDTFIQWEIEGANTEGRNASLHELKHLSLLTNLEIHIRDPKILTKGLFSEKLERYKIYIGDEWNWIGEDEETRMLKLKLNANICMEDEFILQLKGIEVLWLDEVQVDMNVLSKVDKEGFSRLKSLYIQNNPYFQYILDSMKCKSHEAFPSLKSLSLSNLINLEEICHRQLTAQSFAKLNVIKVEKCEKLKNIFSFSTVKSLPQLQTIEVTECKAMEEIFAIAREDDVNNEVIDKIEFSHICSLTLESLPQLSSFCSKVKIPADNEVMLEDELGVTAALFNEMVVLPNLEVLEVSEISVERIWQNRQSAVSSSLKNLGRLILEGCGNLKFLFSSSIVRNFLLLQHLEICKCPVLKEILVMEELEEEEERKDIIFPQLNFLRIGDLDNLTRFCSENCVEFPSLKQLEIKECPNFRAFISKNVTTELIADDEADKMSSVETRPYFIKFCLEPQQSKEAEALILSGIIPKDILLGITDDQMSPEPIQPFFNEKVAFPNLEEMVISNVIYMKRLWHKKFAQNSFGNLKLMKVEGCSALQTLFPSNVIGRFSQLESIIVNNCPDIEEIFGVQGLTFEEIYSIPEFQLKLVSVSDCQHLKNIFPASIARRVQQLENLEIINCRILDKIVAKEGEAESSIVRFVFPMLNIVNLQYLPELSTFYTGEYTLEWPLLKKLTVFSCEKIKLFTSDLEFQKTDDEGKLDIPIQQPFVLIEKIIPSLEELTLSSKDIMMVCRSQFPRHHSGNLKILNIIKDEAPVFPLSLFERFYNLETLMLTISSYKELFSYEEM